MNVMQGVDYSARFEDALNALDSSQLEAVQRPLRGLLPIIAGPGSGKTKVLTMRVANAVLKHDIAPERIVVVTFTNRAAKEMRERLVRLIGEDAASDLVLVTFHSICVRLLRESDIMTAHFTIVSEDESERIVRQLVRTQGLQLDPKLGRESISRAKGVGVDVNDCDAFFEQEFPSHLCERMSQLFRHFQEELERLDALDFDDLLIKGHKLIESRLPEVSSWFRLVCIDEFQDTSTLQFETANLLASHCKSLTTVGDPNQSIYGWRQANPENFRKLLEQWQSPTPLQLESNYRSTANIVSLSNANLAHMRDQLGNYAFEPINAVREPIHPVVHKTFPTVDAELQHLVDTISHAQQELGLRLNDIVILVRFHKLRRVIEPVLAKNGIPYRNFQEEPFLDKREIRDIVSYLKFLDNPRYSLGLQRFFLTRPNLGISTWDMCQKMARSAQSSVLEAMSQAVNHPPKGFSKARLAALNTFGLLTDKALALARDDHCTPDDLIQFMLDDFGYRHYLRFNVGKAERRISNINYLSTFAKALDNPMARPSRQSRQTPTLSRFLTALALGDQLNRASKESDAADRVTISTIHGFKGLEAPMITMPFVDDETYSDEGGNGPEESRVYHVATSRPRDSLVLSNSSLHSPTVSQINKDEALRDVSYLRTASPFLRKPKEQSPHHFVSDWQKHSPPRRSPGLTTSSKPFASILGRLLRRR